MSSSISFNHPSLALGCVVDDKVLEIKSKLDSAQQKMDAAMDKMNSFIMMKRSLSMTVNELTDMNIDIKAVKETLGKVDTSISQSATAYMNTRIACEDDIQKMREQMGELSKAHTPESIVDFVSSDIKPLPLATASLKLDAQYFSYGSNQEDDTIANIEKYIRETSADLGAQADQMAKTASSQIARQRQHHSLAGTLIICANSTHPNVSILDPLIIDPDKAISIWNNKFTAQEDRINTIDKVALKSYKEKKDGDKSISMVSGVHYGSSFVGMVHIIHANTSSMVPAADDTHALQEKIRLGGWLENISGGVGIDPSILDDVRSMLSTQKVSAHISLVTLGVVPSISSGQLKLGVKKLMQPDTSKLNELLVSQASIHSDSNELGATSANKLNQVLSMESKSTASIIRELGEIDHGRNKVMDMNSLMSAFENYLSLIKNENSTGVPIHFQLKKISKSDIIELWLSRHVTNMDKDEKETPSNKRGNITNKPS